MSATQFRRPQEKVRAELFENLQTKFPKKSARGIARYLPPSPTPSGFGVVLLHGTNPDLGVCVWGPTSRSKASDDGSQISPEYLDKETADAIAGIRG
jgi:hypothetical protein